MAATVGPSAWASGWRSITARKRTWKSCIVRPFNAYGPRDYYDTKISHVIPALIKKVLDGDNPVEVWGSGNQSRVFVHAKDFAKGIQLVAEKYPKADPVNVGHDKQITIRELVEKIQVITGIYNDVFYNREKPGKGYPRSARRTPPSCGPSPVALCRRFLCSSKGSRR